MKEKKKMYNLKDFMFTSNFGPQYPPVRGVLRFFSERSGEPVVCKVSPKYFSSKTKKNKHVVRRRLWIIPQKIAKNLQYVKLKSIIIIVSNYGFFIVILITLIRVLTYIYITEFDSELIPSIQKTACMDLPAVGPNHFLITLLDSEITGPQVRKGRLITSLVEFQDIAETLHWDFRRAQTFAIAEVPNDAVQEEILEQTVPERWGRLISRLNSLMKIIVKEYNLLDEFLTQNNYINPYKERIQEHINLLRTIQNDLTCARLDHSALGAAMEKLRAGTRLLDNIIPDNIVVPLDNLNNTNITVVSDLTPFDRPFTLPVISENNLFRNLFWDPITRPIFLEMELKEKLDAFMEITSNLRIQILQSHALVRVHDGDIDKILETPESQAIIKDQLIPESWDYLLRELLFAKRRITKVYLKIDSETRPEYPYTLPMSEHGETLEIARVELISAVENLEPLKIAMVRWREENNCAIDDFVGDLPEVQVRPTLESVNSDITSRTLP